MIYRIFIGIFFLLSCSGSKKCKHGLSSDAEYTRDCSYLKYTVNKWIESDKEGYNRIIFFDSSKPTSLYNVLVDTIVYSSDFSKIAAIVVIEYDTSVLMQDSKDIGSRWRFRGRAIIGYRDSVNSLWKIHDFPGFITGTFMFYKDVSSAMRNYYFDKMSQQFTFGRDNKLVKNEYSLSDCKFWEKSIFWRKGERADNYYAFELHNNGSVISDYKITYPDSLIQLYKQSK